MSDRAQLRKKWKREVSAGGIVFKKQDGQDFVLLIKPFKKDTADQHFVPVWSFPKGWTGDHGDEKLEETALREVREEGGVDCKIIDKVAESKYFFKFDGEDIFKIVHWYLMEYVRGDTANHDKEVAASQWVEADKALDFLNYNADKENFQKALKQWRQIKPDKS